MSQDRKIRKNGKEEMKRRKMRKRKGKKGGELMRGKDSLTRGEPGSYMISSTMASGAT